MKSSIVLSLLLLASVGNVLSSGKPVVHKADEQQELSEGETKHTSQHEDNEIDPRPNIKGFGLPRISVDPPIGRDDPFATIHKYIDDGENLVANTLHDNLGFSIPTKLIEGQDSDQGEELIQLATALLKDLIALPRQHGRLPLGISSSAGRSRHGISSSSSSSISEDIRTSTIGRGISNTPDPQLVQRSMLEIIEQLTRMALDEPSNLQDPAFEQLLDRIKLLIMGFRTKPTLRT